jgi:hypothetical protein
LTLLHFVPASLKSDINKSEIDMFVRRGSREGQSLYIAIGKWLGTLAPTIQFGIMGDGGFPRGSFLILVLGMFCSVFDLIYVWMFFKPRMLDFAHHESIDITGSLQEGKVLGEFHTEGLQGTWKAHKK